MKFSEYVYERPNIEKVKEEYEQLISEFEKAESSEMQNETMKKINTLVRKFSTMQTLASVRHSIDTTDEFYENEKKFYDEVGPVLQGYGVKYYKALDNSKFKDELIKKWGQRLFDIARLEMKTYSDEVVEELKKENELVSAYNKITSSAKIMFKGEERNLSGMTPFMQDIDRKTRKEAAVAMWGFFSENEAELDRIYDEMVKVRTSIAKKLGYKNFVQLGYDRLGRADYNSEMV
ncbi:MAG: M3 family oligoendopeptidase, partial [Candidatus Muiribacteriota bacterium]